MGRLASNLERCHLLSLSAILMQQTISLVRIRFLIGPRTTSARGNMIAFGCVRCFELSAGKTLGEITPGAIEKFKSARLHTVTKRKTKRSPASVKHEIDVLSRIFSLAVTWGLADSNPCSRVSRIKLQNQRYRYLLPRRGITTASSNAPANDSIGNNGSLCYRHWRT